MISLSEKCIILVVFTFSIAVTLVLISYLIKLCLLPDMKIGVQSKKTSDVLEAERASFFGFTHEVSISTTSMELVQQLSEAVLAQASGDRPVRRYFNKYDTPFVGDGRRSGK